MKLNPKPPLPLGPWTEREIKYLRHDADMAYLDGRTARAKVLNKKADDLARRLRRLVRPADSAST